MLRNFLYVTALLGALLANGMTGVAQQRLPAAAIHVAAGSTASDWPADMNGDGITDLVIRGGDGFIRVLRGRGNATFRTPLISTVKGLPLATGDFDGDRRLDVVAEGSDLVIAPGRGDGRLGAARSIGPRGPLTFAVAADLNNDGQLDLVTAGEGEGPFDLSIRPGNGDLTFDAAVRVTVGAHPTAIAVADVNEDRLQDLVIVTRQDGAWLLLNRGGLAFGLLGLASVWSNGTATAVAARDVTGDGSIDLLFSSRFSPTGEAPWTSGSISVAVGQGDGTFVPAGEYPAGAGAQSIIVGDFTHDGIPDVATASASPALTSLVCGSMLAGRGNGSFGAPVSFSLGARSSEMLRAADVNRDGFPDLLAGRGTILITNASREGDVSVTDASRVCDAADSVIAQPSAPLASPGTDGTAHDATTMGVSDTGLPVGWLQQDIGAVGAPGSVTVDPGSPAFPSSTFTVRGSGADIWGTRDEFHYVFRNVSGDFGVLVDVRGVENINQWTKAGIMVRSSSDPGAAHVSLFATPTAVKGLSLQARLQNGGSSVELARVPEAPPVSMRLSRQGSTVRAAWMGAEGGAWNELPPVTIALPESVQIGFAVSSHLDGTLAAGTFFGFEIGTSIGPPERWGSRDIGAVGAAGRATVSGSTVTVRGSGADIWGTADEFHFISQTYAQGPEDDFEVTARVTAVQNVNQWTKAGLMIRTHLGAGAAHASVFVTPTRTKGVAFQRRRAEGAQSVHTSGPALTAPLWLKLIARDGNVRSYYRTDTGPWTFIGEDDVALRGDTLEVGLAVSSHRDGTLATATFDDVSIRPLRQFGTLTAIGGTDACETLDDDGVTTAFTGKGSDIWGTADAFCFFARAWTGDGTLTVRVASVGNSHPWAKAGVMFRESDDPASKHVMAIVSPERGLAMQYRASTVGASANAGTRPGAAPEWLRLVRSGNTFTGSASEDGVTWQTLGTVSVPMNAALLVGLSVTSHNAAAPTTAVFDNITIEP